MKELAGGYEQLNPGIEDYEDSLLREVTKKLNTPGTTINMNNTLMSANRLRVTTTEIATEA